jgi:hypothetical protein
MTGPPFAFFRPMDDAALTQEAAFRERDREEALAFWKQYGTPLLVALLQAQPEPPAA